MKVKITEIKKTLLAILTNAGVSKKDAQVIMTEYLEGELQGKYSHGLAAFPSIAKKLDRKLKKPKVLKKTSAMVYVNANLNFGVVLGNQLADQTMKMADKQGIGSAFISNMSSWLRPATVARYIANKGYVAFVINNGGLPAIAPHGGYTPIFGTNPIGIGIPTSDDPVVTDMATSVRAWGEVRIAKAAGRQTPNNAYLDKTGKVTRDPDKVHAALPFGEYKGSSLAMFVEIMTGSLVNMPMGSEVSKGNYRTTPRGAMILTINPRMTAGLSKFKKQNTKLVREIKRSKKRKGVEVILLPGQRANKRMKDSLKKGYLDVDANVWNIIKGLK